MLVFNLAFRNLFRNLRRTVITSAGVTFAVAAFILGWGFVDGLDENVVRAEEDVIAGHVIVRPDGFPDDGMTLPIDKSKVVDGALLSVLQSDAVVAWAPRVAFGLRIVHGADALRAKGLGVDRPSEAKVFATDAWKIDGQWPEGQQIALGSGLASLLDLHVGDDVAVEARTKAGAINALMVPIAGLVTTRNAGVDGVTVWMNRDLAEDLVRTEGAMTQVAVRLKGRGAADSMATKLGVGGWYAKTASQEVEGLLSINRFRRRAISFVVLILMTIGGVGIANTIIMATYERIKEIGTLRALGMSGPQIRALFLLEGAVMGALAGAVGAAMGMAVVAHYSTHGIDFAKLNPNLARDAGELSFSTILFMHLDPSKALFAFGFATTVALLASLWPAHYAATLNPADAVRAD